MSPFDRRKFLITGAAVLGASGIAAKIGWWYLAQRMPSTAMDAGAHAAGEFPNPLRLPGSSGVLGVLDVSSPLIIVAKGFGIRFAVGSGVLAARSLMDSGNYNVRWRHAFLPGLRAVVVNRAVFGSMGLRATGGSCRRPPRVATHASSSTGTTVRHGSSRCSTPGPSGGA
jgi:hypothetical protein